ncbi:urokinase plasminogen activator surface receptor-like isoform X1 [Xiphophorus couchianus]|uniref:urokinase plasminogen activator surface receptor-like isoform X1 n=1 Tax=Xiphophorus couchianus TaxID=32473 RepID=UPI001016D56E|nr:urokinase plasminogen activator surface receptor-like isoform X1 [Xiphophorus couchianus]
MFLFTLVLVVLFLPEADTLKCKCVPGPYMICSAETTECPSQNYSCLVATKVYFSDGAKIERNSKGCIISELCISYSVNFGAERIVQNTKCCSEDLCNAQINYTKPEYNSTTNGKKCFSCDGENCMKTLNCAGDENYCIKVTENVDGTSLTLKGCASELKCLDKSASLVNQFTEAKISFCQGNYCSSTSPTLLLLLVSLLFSNLFS